MLWHVLLKCTPSRPSGEMSNYMYVHTHTHTNTHTHACTHTHTHQILKNFLKKDCLHQRSRLIHTSLQTHLEQTCRLAWALLTTSPPLVLAKPSKFRDDWLDREFEYWDRRARSSKLYYTRPVLFCSYEGVVGVKGWVGNSLEGAQQMPARNSRTKGGV